LSKTPFLFVSLDGGFGGSYNLNLAINRYSTKYRSWLVTSRPSPYSFGEGIDIKKKPQVAGKLLEEVQRLFVVDCGGLLTIARYLSQKYKRRIAWEPHDSRSKVLYKWLESKSLVFFWSGSAYRCRSAEMNKAVRRLPCARTFAMCDLLRCDPQALPLMQPYDDLRPVPDSDKYEEFTVCHSPGYKHKAGSKGKGTPIIEEALKSLGVRHAILKGLPFKQAVQIKARCHVFVDQMVPTVGGIGKSGLEALCLGLPTLCDVSLSTFSGRYAECPVIHVENVDQLTSIIKKLRDDSEMRRLVSQLSLEWSKRLRFEPTARYLDETLEWR